jgi:hypothetical protein
MTQSASPDPQRIGFTAIDNDLLRNGRRLSCAGRAILFELLSRPPDWRASIESLAETHMLERAHVSEALLELRDAGCVHAELIDLGEVAYFVDEGAR